MQDAPSMFASASDTIKVWNAQHMTTQQQFNCQDLSAGSNFKDVCWNHDNTLLASASTGNGILLYDWTNSNGYGDFYELSKERDQTCVCFSRRENSLFSGGTMGDVSLWNCKSGKKVKTFDGGHQSPVNRLDIIGENKVASACASGEIIIWSVDSATAVVNLKTSKPQSVRGLEHSPWVKSCLGTASDDGSICLWDTEKQETKYIFTSHNAPAMALSFSPLNHLLLASCGLDKKVIFYDIQGNNVVKTINSNQPLTAVCFLSNGVHVCAGTSMGNIYKYDLRQTGEPLNSVHAHSTSVQRLVLQTLKHKSHRKGSRSSKSVSTSNSNSKNDLKPQSPQQHESQRNSQRASHDVIKNRRSWSKIPNLELPQSASTTEVNGDSHLTPAKTTQNRKSQLEKSVGLQTPLNRSVASSRRDTLGSYCEGIFSPVANMNEPMQADGYSSARSSRNIQQRISKGQEGEFSGFHYNSPTAKTSTALVDINNGIGTPDTDEERAGNDAENYVKRSSKVQQHSTPATGASAAAFSSPDSDITEKLPPRNENTSVNTLVNGNMAPSSKVGNGDFIQPNPFQYQLDFLQNTVRELVEEHEDNIRDELRHLHMQFIKMFAEQNERIKQLAEQCSVNPLLLQEIERLRTENDRLRRKF